MQNQDIINFSIAPIVIASKAKVLKQHTTVSIWELNKLSNSSF
jgi:hypothetical protein